MPFDPSTAMSSDVKDLVDAITHVESGGDSNAVSAQGARGSMQIMPSTFQHYAQPGESYDNDDDRRAAAIRKINDDYAHYGGDVAKTAAAYLGGRGAVLADGTIRSDVSDANGTTPASYANMVLSRIAKNTTFDPSTARLVVDASGPATSSFDPATASPTDFDPSTARLMSGAASPTSFDPSTATLVPRGASPTTNAPSLAKLAPGTSSPTTNAQSTATPTPSHLQPGEWEALKSSLAAALNNLPPAQGSQVGPENLAALMALCNPNSAKQTALSQTHPVAPNSGVPSFIDAMRNPAVTAQSLIHKDEPTTWDRVKDYAQDAGPAIAKGFNGIGKGAWGLLNLAVSASTDRYRPALDAINYARQLAENHAAAEAGRAPQKIAPLPMPTLDDASKVVSAGASQAVTATANALTGNHLAASTIAEAPSISQGFAVTDGDLNAMSSDSLLQAQKKLQADTDAQKGFLNKTWATIKGTVSNPQLLASSIEEQIPALLLSTGVATKAMPAVESLALKEADVAGSAAYNAARDKAIAAGADKATTDATAKLAEIEAAKNAAANYIAAKAPNATAAATTKAMTAQGAGTAYVDASNTVMNLPQDVLAKNPNYQRLIEQGYSSDDARSQLAQQAGTAAAIISVPINAAGGRFGISKDVGALVTGTSKTTAKSVAVNLGADALVGYTTGAVGQLGNNAVQKQYGDSGINLEDNVAAAGIKGAINTTAGNALMHGAEFITGNSTSHEDPLQKSDDNANQANQANEKDAPAQNQQPQQNPHSTPTVESTNPDTPAVAAILTAPDIATSIHAAEQAANTPADQLAAIRLQRQGAPGISDAAPDLSPADAARLQTLTKLRDQTPDANTQALLQQHIDALVKAAPTQTDANPDPAQQGKLNDDQTSIGNALAGSPAASKVATLRTARDKTIDPEKDTMADAIVKLGGIDSSAVQYSPEQLDVRGRIGDLSGRVFHRNGLPPDIVGEHLAELGYVDRDQSGNVDKADFQDKLDQVAGGEDVHTPQAVMGKAPDDLANAISNDDINQQHGQASSRFSEGHSDRTSVESNSGNQAQNAIGPGEFGLGGQTHEADQAALDAAHRQVLLARTDAERLSAAKQLVEVNKDIAARQEAGSAALPSMVSPTTPNLGTPQGGKIEGPKGESPEAANSAVAKSPSFASIYAKAPAAKVEIDALADNIALMFDGARVAKAPVKSEVRALQKLNDNPWIAGDPTLLNDLARNTIIVSPSQIDAVAAELSQRGAAVRAIGADSNPLGYSGVNSTIRTSSGLLGEIQVNTPAMIFAKETEPVARQILGDDVYDQIAQRTSVPGGLGHQLYEQYRVLSRFDPQAKVIAKQSRNYYNTVRSQNGS